MEAEGIRAPDGHEAKRIFFVIHYGPSRALHINDGNSPVPSPGVPGEGGSLSKGPYGKVPMPPANALTLDRILATAEDVIRRFGPAKATVVDVARALGVSHAAVYRHVATKAELRDLVVSRWVETTMPALRAIAAGPGPASKRLRRLIDTLIAVKRRRAADDPELFAAYRTLAADAQSVVAAHVEELIGLTATVIRSGVKEGTFRTVDSAAAGRAVLIATSKFHHPVHAAEWADPAIDAAYNDVWQLLMDGLSAAKRPG
jgi:AcrR family transcriptional regulator